MMSRNGRDIDLLQIKFTDLEAIFRSDDRQFLESLARTAQSVTRRYFGRAVGLYAPLYISNYCENYCAYCGFQVQADIQRKRLTAEEIDRECRTLHATGIRNLLILTGESGVHSPVSYIADAIRIAKAYFPNIALEIYPLETEEYRELYLAGADGVTLYQETYNRRRYDELHIAGRKKDYDYRYGAPERMAQAGIRHITLGVLLGLDDWREDVPRLFEHLRSLEKKYPGTEYGLSFPRLQKVPQDERNYSDVKDSDMVKIICTARLLFPRAGINLSTRERAEFRDHIFEFGVTRLSAGSSTRVGGYSHSLSCGQEGQFHVNDSRSLAEVKAMLIHKGYDPVTTDWRHIAND
jgi:2-iminoacetate synthase